MSNETFTVTFWGVRGSHPAPGRDTVRYGGNTACVEVRLDGQVLILDAGTGIIALGRKLAAHKPVEVTLLFSHLHHDHTQGFPFFAPAYIPGIRLHLFGPSTSEQALGQLLERNQTPPVFPVRLRDMAAAKDIRSLNETYTIRLGEAGVTIRHAADGMDGEACVRILRSHAHPGGVYIYRIEWCGRSLIYATDTEGYIGTDRRLVNFARGADLLVHDAQYTSEHYCGQVRGFPSTQGYGHSTAEMACEVAVAADVGRLVLFHHDPGYSDEVIAAAEQKARLLFPNTLAAYEGLELTVGEQQVGNIPATLAQTSHPAALQGG